MEPQQDFRTTAIGLLVAGVLGFGILLIFRLLLGSAGR